MTPRPFMRYVGVVFIAALLAIAFTNGAHGATEPETDVACVVSLSPDVESIKTMHAKGVPYEMVRHLILTDPTNSDGSRWALMQVTRWLYAGRLPPALAVSFVWDLCAMPAESRQGLPAKDDVYLKPFNQGGGLFERPINPEHKDI